MPCDNAGDLFIFAVDVRVDVNPAIAPLPKAHKGTSDNVIGKLPPIFTLPDQPATKNQPKIG
jgi:hypothetical protein